MPKNSNAMAKDVGSGNKNSTDRTSWTTLEDGQFAKIQFRLIVSLCSNMDSIKGFNPDSSTALRGNYSVRFLPNTADMLLTIPLNPAGPFLRALASRMSSNSSWNTISTPWYVSAAETSKNPQSVESASSRPSSLDTVRRCWRSLLFPTIMIWAVLASFCLACRMHCTCCRTTLKLARSQML